MKRPAVVVGGSLNALGVVRSLARGQMPIYVLENSRHCAAGWSRYADFMKVASVGGPSLLESLERLAIRLKTRPVLLLTSDESVNTVSEHREAILKHFQISLPADDLVRVMADKLRFQEFAERNGFAVPRSAGVSTADELGKLDDLQPPVVVKPADKTLVLRGLAERAVKALSISEARNAAQRMLRSAPGIIVQEWIEGSDTEIYFTLFSCAADGRVLGIFPGRKLVCTPPQIGSTGVCVAAPEVQEPLIAETLRFIACVNYRGLGSLEFKRDARSGRFLVIEPTVGRTDWQEEIATLCGLNLPLMTYMSECGGFAESPQPLFPEIAWRASREVGMPTGARLKTVDGFFRWSDPGPALYYYGYERFAQRAWRWSLRTLNK